VLNSVVAAFKIVLQDAHEREELRRDAQALTRRADGAEALNLDRVHDIQALQRNLTQFNQSHTETQNVFQYQLNTHHGQINTLQSSLNTINALLQRLLSGSSPSPDGMNGGVASVQGPFQASSGTYPGQGFASSSFQSNSFHPPQSMSAPSAELYLPLPSSSGRSTEGINSSYGEGAGDPTSFPAGTISSHMPATTDASSENPDDAPSSSSSSQHQNRKEDEVRR
jgi:hypothetical protein